MSAAHLCEVIGNRTLTTPEDRNDDAETNHDLSCCDNEYEKHGRFSTNIVERTRERHKGQVRGVEHQLNTHEHDEDVATDKHTKGANSEEDNGQHDEP